MSIFSFPPLSHEERQYLALWASVPGIGRKRLKNLLNFAAKHNLEISDLWKNIGSYEKFFPPGDGELIRTAKLREGYKNDNFLHLLERYEITPILYDDNQYPPLLLSTPDFPPILFAKGNLLLLEQFKSKDIHPIAIVGTRKITSYGQLVTQEITKHLVQQNGLIISGGMYGVDQIAHRTAIESGGNTIAVLGYGFQYLNLSDNFFESFLFSKQLLLTEYAPAKRATEGTFITRNSIVAGLSQATVVIEAGRDSGSLHTARFAQQYGRLVCAVPGHINNEFSAGTRQLFNQGAKAVASGAEILELIKKQQLGLELTLDDTHYQKYHRPKPLFTNPLHTQIYDTLFCQSMFAEEIAEHLKKPMQSILLALSELEVAGHITQEPGKWEIMEK